MQVADKPRARAPPDGCGPRRREGARAARPQRPAGRAPARRHGAAARPSVV